MCFLAVYMISIKATILFPDLFNTMHCRYMLSRASVPRHSIIKKFAGEEIENLDDLIAVISKLSRGARVPLEYVKYTDRYRNKVEKSGQLYFGNSSLLNILSFVKIQLNPPFCVQSVLVTVDQHGWYAPPQLYTRNDATGLWTAKLAIPLESPFVVSAHHAGHMEANSNSVSPLTESSPMDLKCQHESENTADACIKMQTDEEVVVDGCHSGEDSLVEKKRRRVDEEIAAEGTISPFGDLDDIKGGALRHPSSVESSDLAQTISSNASLAEQVIEPALVMFEVSNMLKSIIREGSFIYSWFASAQHFRFWL
jgi:hypothetical protein